MRKTKVLVVDDSVVMRHMISSILEEIDIEVIGVANNGLEGVQKNEDLNPDVILTDYIMPGYDGQYLVDKVMTSKNPKPIIVLSSAGNSNMQPIFEMLETGAFDYVNKPADHQSKIREVKELLKTKIEAAHQSNIEILKERNKKVSNKNTSPHTFDSTLSYDIILIGASTCGPTAVENVLTKIPENLPIPIVVTQHMPENFVHSFVSRLNNLCKLNVIEGFEGVEIKPGHIYVTTGGANSILCLEENNKIVFKKTQTQYPAYNNPSIDAVFLSATEIFKERMIGVILTGMGKDAAEGLLSIKNNDGVTITQSEKSSVVYGMPREANKRGASKHSLDIKEIGGFIVSSIS